ncbi:MAG TPA: protease inhibitor I42 family protein [Amaricoccus sp.]|nr:protease inhibitor I42 family protein [Amaricoccus sp.]
MRLAPVLAAALIAGPASAETVVVRPDLALAAAGRVPEQGRGSVALAVGDTLRVELPAQPGTGYSWEPRPSADAVLEAIANGADCPTGIPTGRFGAVETVCFAYRALTAGETTVAFVYRRHWETLPDGVLRYDLAVGVEPR